MVHFSHLPDANGNTDAAGTRTTLGPSRTYFSVMVPRPAYSCDWILEM